MCRWLKVLCGLFLLLLTSCSYVYGDKGVIQNRDRDYLKAQSVPPLVIPDGLSSSTIDAHYPVSENYYPENIRTVDLTPPDIVVVQPQFKPTPLSTNITTPTLYKKQPMPNYYFDSYTRSSAKAGASFGSIFDWFKKKPTTAASKPLEKNPNTVENNNNEQNAKNTPSSVNPDTEDQSKVEASDDQNTIKKENYYFDRYSHR